VNEDEDMSKEAKTAIGNYMDLLDVRLFFCFTPLSQMPFGNLFCLSSTIVMDSDH
jgi:hypothetical protein